jgi:hypothetical protein
MTMMILGTRNPSGRVQSVFLNSNARGGSEVSSWIKIFNRLVPFLTLHVGRMVALHHATSVRHFRLSVKMVDCARVQARVIREFDSLPSQTAGHNKACHPVIYSQIGAQLA